MKEKSSLYVDKLLDTMLLKVELENGSPNLTAEEEVL